MKIKMNKTLKNYLIGGLISLSGTGLVTKAIVDGSVAEREYYSILKTPEFQNWEELNEQTNLLGNKLSYNNFVQMVIDPNNETKIADIVSDYKADRLDYLTSKSKLEKLEQDPKFITCRKNLGYNLHKATLLTFEQLSYITVGSCLSFLGLAVPTLSTYFSYMASKEKEK